MEKQEYCERWLIPQLGLTNVKTYPGQPVGNRIEFMSLENSFNNDIQAGLLLHCTITSHLSDDNERILSLKTLERIVDGIEQIYGNRGVCGGVRGT